METGKFLAFNPGGKDAIQVIGKGSNSVSIISTNMHSSMGKDRSNSVNAITFVGPKSDEEVKIIALRVETDLSISCFLVRVALKDGKPYIDPVNPWIPPIDRLMQIRDSNDLRKASYVVVTLPNGTGFCSNENYAQKHEYKFVSDADLLSRFVAKDKGVNIKMLEKAVQEIEREKSEIKQLKAQLELSKTLNEQESQELQNEVVEWKARAKLIWKMP